MTTKKKIEEPKKKRGRPRKNAEAETKQKTKKKDVAKDTKKYYSLDEILKIDADFNLIFGQKGNGKTTACLEYLLKKYIETGDEFVIMRRWRDDFMGARSKSFFSEIVSRGKISEWTGGKWDSVVYWQSAWYLAKTDAKKGKTIKSNNAFAYARALTMYEHDNGNQYPKVFAIFFDEFITDNEIADEFVQFMKCYDNLKRRKDKFKVYMCGNTINFFSTYWENFGLDVRSMKQGEIYVDEVEEHGVKVKIAAEYCANLIGSEEKATINVFADRNKKLKMIVTGEWEIGDYAHGEKYLPKEKLFHFFIQFYEYIFKCDVVQKENGMYIKIYKYTGDIDEDAYIYTQEIDADFRHMHALGNDKISTLFKKLLQMKKVFYDSNLTGNIIDSWLKTVN